MRILNKAKVTFLDEVKLPLSKQDPLDRHFGKVQLYLSPVIE